MEPDTSHRIVHECSDRIGSSTTGVCPSGGLVEVLELFFEMAAY